MRHSHEHPFPFTEHSAALRHACAYYACGRAETKTSRFVFLYTSGMEWPRLVLGALKGFEGHEW